MRLALSPLCLTLLLAACGGGGGGGGGGASTPAPQPPSLSGVVSVGAPLGGAQIAVVDAKGTALGTATANPVDGRYSLTLAAASPSLPLLLQARGVDAAGLPVLLHTLVSAAPNASSTTAHLTPLTQAQAALALGADPQAAFAKPADAKLVEAAAQLSAADTFLKSLLKTPLTDLKFTDASKLNLQTDSGFATAKSNADLLLESTRVAVEASSGKLLLGNKFLSNPAPEIELSLASARAELAKGSSGNPASAISSTLKLTSNATIVLGVAGSLDSLVTSLNPLLAQSGVGAASFAALPALAGYERHDGRELGQLSTQLQDWAAKGLQLGPLQVLGCEDETLKVGDCLRVRVASTLSDRAGKPVDRFIDVVGYSSTAKRWNLLGNGKYFGFEVLPASSLRLQADGSLEAGGTNPAAGAEVRLQDGPLISNATVQTPLGYALPLQACGQSLLCIAPASGSLTPRGAPLDQLLLPGAVGWLGTADGQHGALYKASFTRGVGPDSRRAHLPAAALLAVPAARHPQLDGVSASAPLSRAAFAQGVKLSWAQWAKAQPDLRLLQARLLFRYPSGPITERSVLASPGSTELDFPSASATGPQAPAAVELWLSAADGAGRRYYTRYSLGV